MYSQTPSAERKIPGKTQVFEDNWRLMKLCIHQAMLHYTLIFYGELQGSIFCAPHTAPQELAYTTVPSCSSL